MKYMEALRNLISFSTRQKKGNSNKGHTYGTQLPKQDKERLVQYLKTL